MIISSQGKKTLLRATSVKAYFLISFARGLGIRAKVVIFQDGRWHNVNNGKEMEIIEFLINPGFVMFYKTRTERNLER